MDTIDKLITSVHNPKVKRWTELLSKKGRDASGQYIVEGIHLVKEALQADLNIECVVFAEDRPLPNELVEAKAVSSSSCEWIQVTSHILARCTTTQTPQSVFAVVSKQVHDKNQLWSAERPLVVLLDGVQDPGNVGTIIRSAEASGATGIILGKGSVDLYNPKTVRAAMGSLFRIPIIEGGDLTPYLQEARSRGIHVVSTGLDAARHCYEMNWEQGIWFIVGNEGAGVSSEVATHVDELITIPMQGRTESLNVAMATTVLLFEAMRQRGFA